MSRRTLLVLLVVLLPVAFVGGWLASRGTPSGGGGRTVLYYVDPMNPSFRSPEPGTAPCGMPLEPVYADGPAPAAGSGSATPGAVAVRADRLQLIGVSRAPVTVSTLRSTLRLVGTVAADETRLFRITAATAGRIREMGTATTGSLVGRGEILGAYYTTETLVPQQNFLRMYETYQKIQQGGTNLYDNFQGGGQLATYARNVDVARQALLNLGVSAEQLEEVTRTRQPAYLVQIRAPAAGIVTSRNVSLGQTFDEREDLFTVADLERVWVLADAFEGQEEFFKPGTAAVVRQLGAGRRFAAVVSAVPPRFDAATRTLKVRLDVANPALLLRPDMLVDVELPVEIGPALFVPKEAVLDSGMRRLVFVEQGEGVFVPRTVRTGRRLGEHVEIVGGLMAGETVVTSGNFLLDSESRMRAAGAAAAGAALDPICGMEVEEGKARSQGLVSEHGGTSWFFCTPGCKQAFDRDPKAATARALGVTEPMAEMHPGAGAPPAAAPSQKAFHMEDPVCGMNVDPDESARAGLTSGYQGAQFSFCSPECKQIFDRDPRAVLSRPRRERAMPAAAGMTHEGGHGGTIAPLPGPLPGPPREQMREEPDEEPYEEMDEERDEEHDEGSHEGMHEEHRERMPEPMPRRMPAEMPAGGDTAGHAAGAAGAGQAVDPVCRMEVDPAQARAAGLVTEHNGVTWYFCTLECKQSFDDDPTVYLPLVR